MGKDQSYDVVVVGAGAGGLSAATFAALDGARVLLIERTEFLGGTTAFSAGTTWVPNTRLSETVGANDSEERALTYLDNAVGNRAPRSMRQAFLSAGPEAIHRLMDDTIVQFRARPFHPDYLYELEGSTKCGRAIEPQPFRATELGRDLSMIRPAIPEFTILGGLQVDRDDINHLLSIGKSFKSFLHSVRLIGTYAMDKLRFGRSARLVMGNALVGRLFLAARKAGVEIRLKTQVSALNPDGEGWKIQLADGGVIYAEGGVIVATGGYGRHPERRTEMLPAPLAEHSPAAPGHTGELHDILQSIGAHYGEGSATNAFWAPVSKRQRPDGSWAVFPHFVFDRSKPGIIAVDQTGNRFTNEARSYHEFGLAQYASGAIPAFLIADAIALKKYGLGMVRPGGMGAKGLIADGYLVTAPTVPELAKALDISESNLVQTVARMNEFARTGVDADFRRGETVYECANGDAGHGPNPTLGPIGTGPFYAVRLWPADIGAATGFAIDEKARILGPDNVPIEGLFACGNDAQSIMGGVYPGPGITIGPAITFGYLAAKEAVKRSGIGE